MKIEFDYRFDSSGFFNSLERRAALETAGQIWSDILQDDFENIPVGAEFTINNPTTGILETVVLEREIDDIIIFVGATNNNFNTNKSTDSNQFKTLAQARVDGTDLSGDIFQRRVNSNFRDLGTATDFEPWAGTISFNNEVDWDFSLETFDSSKKDFISITLHEIAHILGVGTAPVFENIGEGGLFDGINSVNLNNGSPVPLEEDLGHVEEGFADNRVLLDPIFNGVRNLPDDFDLALLADIGYVIPNFTPQGSIPELSTDGGEQIFGSNIADVIDGLGEDDSIQGNDGNDIIYGGSGEDTIFGDGDKDLIFGNEDGDILQGGLGDDTINGGNGLDRLFGQQDKDLLFGGNGNDELQGNEESDTLHGGDGNDTIFGQQQADLALGNEGDDQLQGGEGNDTLMGNSGNDIVLGQEGDDLIYGGEGNDTLMGQEGSDRFFFELDSGNDVINDFVVAEDKIEVSRDFGFREPEELLSAIFQSGGVTDSDLLFSDLRLSTKDTIRIFHDRILLETNFEISSTPETNTLRVTDFQQNSSGFTVSFSQPLNTDVLNLYVDSPDLIVTQTNTGETVRGSFFLSEDKLNLTFIASGNILESDRYTVRLLSSQNAFVSETGEILDGDLDLVSGGDYITQFEIDNSDARVLSLEDFSQGRGEEIEGDNNIISITLDNAQGVNRIDFTLKYNPNILDLEDILINPLLGEQWNINSKNLNDPGTAIVTLSGSTPLVSESIDLVSLKASVPEDAIYGSSDLVRLESVSLNESNISVVGDSALQQVLKMGDVTGDDRLSDRDAHLIANVIVGSDTGFDAFNSIDPNLVGDVDGNGFISAFDSFLVTQES